MFRYFAGLVLVQMVTLGLFVSNADGEPRTLAIRTGLPAVAIALLAALWFRSLSRADAERDLARERLEHERERERLALDAERQRADITLAAERERSEVARSAEQTIRREERRVGRRASLQVGLAFTATAGMGVLFVLSELVTLGLLTLTTAGGALGGYLLRWRQGRAQSAAQARGHDASLVPGTSRVPAARRLLEPSTRPGDTEADRFPASGGRPVDAKADAAGGKTASRATSAPARAAPEKGTSLSGTIALPAPPREGTSKGRGDRKAR